MTHTPTPWRVSGQAGLTIVGEDSHPIADTCFVNDEANAAFIVRAVNSHETLVSALKDAVSQLEALTSPLDVPDSCRAALAAEKEEAA